MNTSETVPLPSRHVCPCHRLAWRLHVHKALRIWYSLECGTNSQQPPQYPLLYNTNNRDIHVHVPLEDKFNMVHTKGWLTLYPVVSQKFWQGRFYVLNFQNETLGVKVQKFSTYNYFL